MHKGKWAGWISLIWPTLSGLNRGYVGYVFLYMGWCRQREKFGVCGKLAGKAGIRPERKNKEHNCWFPSKLKDLYYLDVVNETWFFAKSGRLTPGKVYDHTAVMDAAGRMWLTGGYSDRGPNSKVFYLEASLEWIWQCSTVTCQGFET